MGLPWWLGGGAAASASGEAPLATSPAEAVRERGVEHDLERVSDLVREIESEEQTGEPSGQRQDEGPASPEAPEHPPAARRGLGFWRGGMRSSGGGYGKRVDEVVVSASGSGAAEKSSDDGAAAGGESGERAPSVPAPAPAPVGSVIPLGPIDPRPFPPAARDAALLTAGMLLVGASTVFYRRKMTRPFKMAYFFAWPVLGSAVVLNASPDPSKVRDEVEAEGQGARREEAQRHARAQIEALRRIAQDQ